MISLHLENFAPLACALLVGRLYLLYRWLSRKSASVRIPLLRRFAKGGRNGFIVLTGVLSLRALGAGSGKAWVEVFFTDDLDVGHLAAVLVGFVIMRSRLLQEPIFSKDALSEWGFDVGVVVALGLAISIFDVPNAISLPLYGIRMLSYPILLVLALLTFRVSEGSEDLFMPVFRIVEDPPTSASKPMPPPPISRPVGNVVYSITYNTTNIVINQAAPAPPPKAKQATVIDISPPESPFPKASAIKRLTQSKTAGLLNRTIRGLISGPSKNERRGDS